MKICLFYHSVVSDWNNGNAHFLRGIISSLVVMGHDVSVFEPEDGWSYRNLMKEKGKSVLQDFCRIFPFHAPVFYNEKDFDPGLYLKDADLVIVHEWNDPGIVKKIGDFRSVNAKMILLFHDTHHRSVTAPGEMARYDLSVYDGVLAFGDVIREIYLARGWTRNVWTWHEAADDSVFHPVINDEKEGDLVWIGNWGDDERTDELLEFIVEPVMKLGLKAAFYGVRYPKQAIRLLKKAGIRYNGWLPNFRVPEIFGKYRVTVHVPRRPYVEYLPGIPTIRPFEALACMIPLVCSPWNDKEHLFTPGMDYLVANNGEEMTRHLKNILSDNDYAASLSRHGLETIRRRHTCDHRAEELMNIITEIQSRRRERIFNDPVHVEQ